MADEATQRRPEQAAGDSGRERILRAAYEEFSRSGVKAVGVDSVIAKAGVAKMTLYRNFPSKDELVLAFLERREETWTYGWLAAAATGRGTTPRERLLAIFDVFGEWFASAEFEGCSFIRVLLETSDTGGPVLVASVQHLENIRAFLRGLAEEAGVDDADAFARSWHILMKGSIIAALEGDTAAARRSQELGRLLLDSHGITT